MSLFLWKRSYEIRIPEIDSQHRRLVAIINELSDAMMVRQGYRRVPHVLEELVDYIQLHFSTEENLMHKINYPGLDEHSQEHLDITDKVLKFNDIYAKNQELDPSDLLDFLCDWLKKHMIGTDKEFGRYIQSVEV